MASISSTVAVAAPASVKTVIQDFRFPSSSGRCSFKGSSVFGTGLELPVLSQRTQLTEGLSVQHGDLGRARASVEGGPQLPASHRFKAASAAAFEQLRNQKLNSE